MTPYVLNVPQYIQLVSRVHHDSSKFYIETFGLTSDGVRLRRRASMAQSSVCRVSTLGSFICFEFRAEHAVIGL